MSRTDVVVVGAGVFGVWTALELQQKGLSVCLVDAWGVAHSRASSSGESRVIRMGYADRSLYSEWSAYALQKWMELERHLETTLFIESGVLWLGSKNDEVLRQNKEILDRLRIAFEVFGPAEMARRFPQIATTDVHEAVWEPNSGVLLARLACREVAKKVVRDGGRFRLGSAEIPGTKESRLPHLRVWNEVMEADSFVFCCGPWMSELFPELLGSKIQISRQEVFFFGMPPGDENYLPGHFPAWLDLTGDAVFYGLPAVDSRSVKLACDETGPSFDPTLGERVVNAEELDRVRTYLAKRLPALQGAPLLESRVCQYSRTEDSHLVIDRHPEWENVILAGAGSGHGFKLGPAVGRLAAQLVVDPSAEPPEEVQLSPK